MGHGTSRARTRRPSHRLAKGLRRLWWRSRLLVIALCCAAAVTSALAMLSPEPLQLACVDQSAESQDASDAFPAPPGTVVVPVRLDTSLTAVIQEGDYIDVVASDAQGYLARRALVLPNSTPTAGSSGLFGTGPGQEVTLLAVSPDEAPALSTAALHSTVAAVLVP